MDSNDQIKKNSGLFFALLDDDPDLTEEARLQKVKNAVENGALVNAIDKNTEKSVLQTAKSENYLTIVQYLSDMGATDKASEVLSAQRCQETNLSGKHILFLDSSKFECLPANPENK